MPAFTVTSLAHTFLLDYYLDAEGRFPFYLSGLEYGLSGAVLMEMAERGAVRAHGDVLRRLVPWESTIDDAVDRCAVRGLGARSAATTEHWVRAVSGWARNELVDDLERAGYLARRRPVLGLVPRRAVSLKAQIAATTAAPRTARNATRLTALKAASGLMHDSLAPSWCPSAESSDYTQRVILDSVWSLTRSMCAISVT